MNIEELGWTETSLVVPENGVVVDTVILDKHGCRGRQRLIRIGNAWLSPDRSIHMYYTPTHWKPL